MIRQGTQRVPSPPHVRIHVTMVVSCTEKYGPLPVLFSVSLPAVFNAASFPFLVAFFKQSAEWKLNAAFPQVFVCFRRLSAHLGSWEHRTDVPGICCFDIDFGAGFAKRRGRLCENVFR